MNFRNSIENSSSSGYIISIILSTGREALEFSNELRKFVVPHTTTEAYPDKSRDLFVVRRVYVNQKNNTSFQKRYLYFLEAPERFSIVKTKMFVEFRGSDNQGEENVASM